MDVAIDPSSRFEFALDQVRLGEPDPPGIRFSDRNVGEIADKDSMKTAAARGDASESVWPLEFALQLAAAAWFRPAMVSPRAPSG